MNIDQKKSNLFNQSNLTKLGSKMLEILENDDYAQEAKKIVLSSSMSAFRFYQKMGYKFPNGEFELMQDVDDTYGMTLEKDL